MHSIDLTLYDKLAIMIKADGEEEEKDGFHATAIPGDLLVVKGAKTSDFKGRTVVAYEDTSTLYYLKD